MIEPDKNPERKHGYHTERQLVVYNDDVHTFDDVIDSLWIACGHDEIQAEQCAVIIHTKGYCTVKYGDYDELQPMMESLQLDGLNVMII